MVLDHFDAGGRGQQVDGPALVQADGSPLKPMLAPTSPRMQASDLG